MMRLFRQVTLRHLLGEPVRAGLSILGIALGVAVFVGIRLANSAAFSSFSATVDAVSGKTTLQIVSADGTGVPEDLFTAVRALPGVEASTPVIEAVPVVVADNRPVIIMGVDVFSDGAFRTYTPAGAPSDGRRMLSLLVEPRAVLLSSVLADRYAVGPGDSLWLGVQGRRQGVVVRGVLELDGPARALGGQFGVMDIAAAQELFGRAGVVDRIDLMVQEERVAELEARLARLLPANVIVERPEARSLQTVKMLRAFDLNLSALAVVATFVAVFLIYNTVLTGVIRRRKEIGALRSVGAGRGTIFLLFLLEVLVTGILGAALGIGGGVLLARAAVDQVASTVSVLYILVSVEEIPLDSAVLIQGLLLGVLASLLGAIAPAWEAARVPIRETLAAGTVEQKFRRHLPVMLLVGTTVLGLAALAVTLPAVGGMPLFGFAGAALLLLGAAIFAPAIVVLVARMLRHPLRVLMGVEASLACDSLSATLRRSSVAVGALAAALAMVIGVDTMIRSFRTTVDQWIQQSVRFDLFVGLQSNTISAAVQSPRPAEVLRYLRTLPEVETVDTYRGHRMQLGDAPTTLASVSITAADRAGRLTFRSGDHARIVKRAATGEAVLVSEPFALRRGTGEGDTLMLPTPEGVRGFPVAGVFYDYTTDGGMILMERDRFTELWRDTSVSDVALALRDASSVDAVMKKIEERFSATHDLVVFSNAGLRRHILTIFDQTFAITYALQLIAAVVAGIGVASALLTITIERRRELGILGAVGAGAGSIRRMVLIQGGLMGAMAHASGTLTGLGLSLILVYVINRQSFGWTIQFHPEPITVLLAGGAAVVIAGLAAVWPAIVASRKPVAEALRYE